MKKSVYFKVGSLIKFKKFPMPVGEAAGIYLIISDVWINANKGSVSKNSYTVLAYDGILYPIDKKRSRRDMEVVS